MDQLDFNEPLKVLDIYGIGVAYPTSEDLQHSLALRTLAGQTFPNTFSGTQNAIPLNSHAQEYSNGPGLLGVHRRRLMGSGTWHCNYCGTGMHA